MSKPANTQDGTQLVIDHRLEPYSSFFDHEWARRLFDLTDGTKLSQLALDLCTDWKGAANTFRMPWLMMRALDSFQKGFTQSNEPFWEKLTRAFREHVLTRMGSSLSNMKRKELIRIIDRLSQEVQEDIRRTPSPFQMEQVWADHLKISEFDLSLWSSQRLCYGAVYHAYENFLRRCVAIAKNDHAYRPPRARVLQDDLNTCIGANVGDDSLGDGQVVTARLVRNSLAHNGGRATREIALRPHKLTIKDGTIHIMPDDVRHLFGLLKDKVLRLVEAATPLRPFKVERAERSP